ncbi:MAG: hypothetical protein ACR2QE_07640 [Acidimicrobiales bacterium]
MADRSRSKRSRDETRQLMLEAGAELVYEAFDSPGAADWAPVAHVRLTDVASRASTISPGSATITTGAIYPIWEDQNAYRHDLILHLLSPSLVRTDNFWASFTELLSSPDRPPTIEGMVELIAHLNFATVTSDPFYYLLYAVIPYCGDERIREAVRKYITAEQGKLLQFYRFGLLSYGRRLRDEYEDEDVARALSALFDGLALSHRAGRDMGKHSGMQLPDLLAASASAILIAFSEPINPPTSLHSPT